MAKRNIDAFENSRAEYIIINAAGCGAALKEYAHLLQNVCCGSAGIYNITQPEMSRRLQERKIQHVLATQADVVVTANPGCFMQLASGLQRAGSNMRVMHIVDVLDLAYRET